MAETSKENYFGLLRNNHVDEIELEPIDSGVDNDFDGSNMNEGYDEILYR